MIQALVRDSKGIRPIEATPGSLRAALAAADCVLWVDLQEASPEEAELFSTVFNFHPLAIEDCLGHVEHPKLDDYGGYLYVVSHGFDYEHGSLQVRELDLFLGSNYLVTYHHETLRCIAALWDRAQRDERYLARGADGMAHAAIDLLVDDLMPVLDKLDASIEQLEDEILAHPRESTLAQLLDIKRATLRLRRTVVPQREVAYRLSRDDSSLVRPKIRLYFRDVYDHLVRVVDINDALRDLVSGALEIYLTVVSNRMNEIIKVLTVVTTVFMPAALVSGVYGMNFRFMPELSWRYGYFGAVAVMLISAIGLAYWFRRRGWV